MNQSIPSISKDSPLKIESATEKYTESDVERNGKIYFVIGIVFALLVLIGTWGVFVAWLRLV